MRLHISKVLIDGVNGLTVDDSGRATPSEGGTDVDWTVGCQATHLRIEDLAAVSGRKMNVLPDKRFVRAVAVY